MASLSRKGKEPEQAVEAYARALAEDPWLWEAFVGLCDIGESWRKVESARLMSRRPAVYGERIPKSSDFPYRITEL